MSQAHNKPVVRNPQRVYDGDGSHMLHFAGQKASTSRANPHYRGKIVVLLSRLNNPCFLLMMQVGDFISSLPFSAT